MRRLSDASRWLGTLLPVLALAACARSDAAVVARGGAADGAPPDTQVLRGRHLVIEHDCGACHGGGADPAATGWLAGMPSTAPGIPIGACAQTPGAQPCFRMRPRNLTPDSATGLGRFTERQIFNALRFGLRPRDTPDVTITSTTPGQGNHPANPKYLGPPMPWPDWRYMSDADLRAIAAYLKRGVKPVANKVQDSDAPPDFWASAYTPDKIGPYPPVAFPTANEQAPAGGASAADAKVLRGRQMVLEHACGECHGGRSNPSATGWLAGLMSPQQEFKIGPCSGDTTPCFHTRPRNLTPDNTTGLGRFTERQIFNALRYGLRPGETPDVEITSTTPGQGNFPANPKYLAPPMPWPAWRHMPDADLLAIAAYLKRGVKPVSNRVQDSEGPPDFWASGYTVEKIGPHPAKPFPTANEVATTAAAKQ